jgi:putative peptidoglycan lipid II flippase
VSQPEPPTSSDVEVKSPEKSIASAQSAATERSKIGARAGIVGLGTLASRIFGLGRDVALAALFPVLLTDAFWIAFTIPNAFRQLLAEGAVSSAVLPVLMDTKEKEGEAQAQLFYAKMRALSLFLLLVVSVLGVVGAPYLVRLFAGGYTKHPEQFARTVQLTRWVFPYIFFMGTAALGMAALHTHRRFVAASFAPALLNISLILCSLLLPRLLQLHGIDPVLALAFGALIGGGLQVLAQMPSLRAIGYLQRPRWWGGDPKVKEVFRRIVPMTLGMGIYYIDLVVCRRFLSEMPTGSQSYFSWAQRLCDFPQGIFVMAIQTATLPSLASLAARGEKEELSKTFSFGMRLSLFVAIPMSVFYMVMAQPLVASLFQRGEFQAESVKQTALALVVQAMGIWMVAVVRQLVPVFYVLGDTKRPVLVSGLDLLALIVFAVVLRGPLGHLGVGLAVTGSSLVQMILLWALLQRKFTMRAREIMWSAGKIILSALIAGAVVSVLIHEVQFWLSNMWGRWGMLILGSSSFGALYIGIAWLLRSDEMKIVVGGLVRKVAKRFVVR